MVDCAMTSPSTVSDSDLSPPTAVLNPADGASARDYIAAMAAELSCMASTVGEARLAETLSRAADLARGAEA